MSDFFIRTEQAPAIARFFPGLPEGHGLVGRACPACGRAIEPGQPLALVIVGPGDDQEEREKRERGQVYNAVGVAVHRLCSGEMR